MEESAVLVIGALIGSYLTHVFSRKANHRQWVRDSRMVAYSRFLSAAYRTRSEEMSPESRQSLSDAYSEVGMLGSGPTADAAASVVSYIFDESPDKGPPGELIATFIQAAREDLQTNK